MLMENGVSVANARFNKWRSDSKHYWPGAAVHYNTIVNQDHKWHKLTRTHYMFEAKVQTMPWSGREWMKRKPVAFTTSRGAIVTSSHVRQHNVESKCLPPFNRIAKNITIRKKTTTTTIIIIIMYIYHALINTLRAHMIHINLNMIFYTHVNHSPTKTICIRYYM